MTEHNSQNGQRLRPGEPATSGFGEGDRQQEQSQGGRYGAGQQGQGGYGQGSYGYGQNSFSGQQSQAQRGKPPRGYQRSDDRLRELICERLMEDGRIDASDVEITVQGGRVTLEGSIDSRMAKYQIEDIIKTMGVDDVQNNLRIARDGPAAGPGSEQGTAGRSSQSGSSGGVSSLGMSGSGTLGGDRTSTGDSSSDASQPSPDSSAQ